MKKHDKYLNPLQLLHRTTGCAGKKCECPGCTDCLCGMRDDAKCCCPLHRSLMNNKRYDVIYYQTNENRKINNRNQHLFLDLWNRGFRKIDETALNIRGVNFSVKPLSVIIAGRKLMAYGSIGVWMDKDKMYHLEKIL
jgi:hypothetical protein